ncbi:terpene synthase family protein [Actinomadura rubrisoli]|uniref:Terpene synthase n=1 Tax=Actinomadura rubrisoli TaxID=2530368 RepID=A0A4R5BGK6_9ACTN|nr:hypothetical protein [Actinomadura rubrisoli]TDD84413.1 hypothetical protein E1298_19970 [Actinomadura rubrisoli]
MAEHLADSLLRNRVEVPYEPNETAVAIGQRRPSMFLCPIAPPPPNPDMDRARAHTLEWVQEMGIITTDSALGKLDDQRHDFWSAVTFPTARGDIFDLQNDWVVWLAMYDDYNEVRDTSLRGTLAEDSTAVLYDAPAPITTDTNPLTRGLADLWRRTREYDMSPQWFKRLAKWMSYFIEMEKKEAEWRRDRTWLTLDRYLEYRMWIGCIPGLPYLDMLSHGAEPSERMMNTPEIRTLMRLTSDYSFLVNDVYGYDRDQGWGDHLNTVVILQHDRDHDLEAAIGETISMADAAMRSYMRVRGTVPTMHEEMDIPADERANTFLFVGALDNWCRAVFDYHLVSARYSQIPPKLDHHQAAWIAEQTGWSDRDGRGEIAGAGPSTYVGPGGTR